MKIIANKSSGKGNGAKCLSKVESYLNLRNIAYTVYETERTGHGMALAQKLSDDGADTIVALGGDGTFHEVLNGINFNKSRMGLIPAGRGNDFAGGTKAASLDPVKAIADVVRGEHKNLDYIQIADRRCINVAGTGIDVEVLLKTAKSKNKLTYTASLFRCLLKYKPYPMEITANGETYKHDCLMVGVCNGSQFGGGMQLAPIAIADDGKLNVIIIEKPKFAPTIFVMPKFLKGKHIDKPYTHLISCESVKIQTPAPLELDGEIYYDLPFDAHIVKGGLKTFATDTTLYTQSRA